MVFSSKILLANSFLTCNDNSDCGIEETLTCCNHTNFKAVYIGKNPSAKRHFKIIDKKYCDRIKCEKPIKPFYIKKAICTKGICKIDTSLKNEKECETVIGNRNKCAEDFKTTDK